MFGLEADVDAPPLAAWVVYSLFRPTEPNSRRVTRMARSRCGKRHNKRFEHKQIEYSICAIKLQKSIAANEGLDATASRPDMACHVRKLCVFWGYRTFHSDADMASHVRTRFTRVGVFNSLRTIPSRRKLLKNCLRKQARQEKKMFTKSVNRE